MDKQLHQPDFIAPDFTQPSLEQADLSTPGFTLPDPEQSVLSSLSQLPLWPDGELDRLNTNQPDPDSPDLTGPEIPTSVTQPEPGAHMLPEPTNEPDVVMQQRPGEMDPTASEILLGSPDREELPPGITYPQLYTADDEMSARKRHLGILELGLEQGERDTQ